MRRPRLRQVIGIFCGSLTALALACSLLPASLSGAGNPDQGGAAPSGPIGSVDDGSDDLVDPDLLPPAAAGCPTSPQQAVLFISHTFDWAPNRDKSIAEIQGQTEASSPCPLTIDGNTVTSPGCLVSYTNTGAIHGSGGDCQVQGQGQAEVSIEGSCDQGKVTLTITEMPADETPGATMTCPNQSTPYVTYYPPSLTTRTFQIQVGGDEAVEDADPDLTNQFSYHKTWALRVEGLTSPLPDE